MTGVVNQTGARSGIVGTNVGTPAHTETNAANIGSGVLPVGVTGGSGLTALGTITAGNVSNTAIVYPSGHILGIAQLQDRKTAGANGGASINGTECADLTTEVFDTGGFVSLSSNQFTLLSGTYFLQAKKTCYRCNTFTLRIYDVTNGAYVGLAGSNAYNESNATNNNLDATLNLKLTASGTTVYELRYYASLARSSNGLGTGQGQTEEVYAEVNIYKLQP